MIWKSHPARERPAAAVFVTLFIAVLMAIVYIIMQHSLFMTVIAGVILVVSLSTFYFPTTFTIDEKNVSIKYLFSSKARNLSAFRQCYPESKGILLSPYLSPSRLENFRGFYLRYGKNNKIEVDAFVKNLIETSKAEAPIGGVKPDAV